MIDAAIADFITAPEAEAIVDANIAELVDSAPSTLDTLNEIAAALGDDPNAVLDLISDLSALSALVATLPTSDTNAVKGITSPAAGDYTLVIGDANKLVEVNSAAAARNLNIPLNSSVPFALGTVVFVRAKGTRQVTIQRETAGVTVNNEGAPGLVTLAQYEVAMCTKVATDEWTVNRLPGTWGRMSRFVYEGNNPLSALTGGATTTLQLQSFGNNFSASVTGNATIAMSDLPAGADSSMVLTFSLFLDINSGGPYTITWPASFKWAGGLAPTISASTKLLISGFTNDGGTTWFVAASAAFS